MRRLQASLLEVFAVQEVKATLQSSVGRFGPLPILRSGVEQALFPQSIPGNFCTSKAKIADSTASAASAPLKKLTLTNGTPVALGSYDWRNHARMDDCVRSDDLAWSCCGCGRLSRRCVLKDNDRGFCGTFHRRFVHPHGSRHALTKSDLSAA